MKRKTYRSGGTVGRGIFSEVLELLNAEIGKERAVRRRKGEQGSREEEEREIDVPC